MDILEMLQYKKGDGVNFEYAEMSYKHLMHHLKYNALTKGFQEEVTVIQEYYNMTIPRLIEDFKIRLFCFLVKEYEGQHDEEEMYSLVNMFILDELPTFTAVISFILYKYTQQLIGFPSEYRVKFFSRITDYIFSTDYKSIFGSILKSYKEYHVADSIVNNKKIDSSNDFNHNVIQKYGYFFTSYVDELQKVIQENLNFTKIHNQGG